MPNIASAKKRLRQNEKLRMHNRAVKSNIHTLGKKVLVAIAAGNKESALELYKKYSSALDKAGRRSIIHKNRSSARKSSMMNKINALG